MKRSKTVDKLIRGTSQAARSEGFAWLLGYFEAYAAGDTDVAKRFDHALERLTEIVQHSD